MQVILHIGLAKTGTTFLQRWLRGNLDTLARNARVALAAPPFGAPPGSRGNRGSGAHC